MEALPSISAFLAHVGLPDCPNNISAGRDIEALPPLRSLGDEAGAPKDLDNDIARSFGQLTLGGLLTPSSSYDSDGPDWKSVGSLPPMDEVFGDGRTASFSILTMYGPPVPSVPKIFGGLPRVSLSIGERKKRKVSKKMTFLRNAVRAQPNIITLV